MSREIKFRAWDGEKMIQNWAYVDYPTREGWLWLHNPTTMGVKSIMQFTGLLETKVSKEVKSELYENDIVWATIRGSHFVTKSGIIKFHQGAFVVHLHDEDIDDSKPMSYYTELELIGNSFENPNLLEAL